jgi:hypothetical protein
MLTISDHVADAFTQQGFARLRQLILTGWSRRLSAVATRAGDEGRNRVLAQVETAAKKNPRLTEVQLVMLADVALVRQTPPPPSLTETP